jgi:thiol-disulfide isomerase/thioredoxin
MSEEKMEGVIYLTNSNFDDNMNLTPETNVKSKCLILFYSPQCPHCVHFKPTYKELVNDANALNATIAAVNTQSEKELMQRMHQKDKISDRDYIIEGVPMVVSYFNKKYFSTYGADDEAKYRTLPDLKDYVNGIGNANITYVERKI